MKRAAPPTACSRTCSSPGEGWTVIDIAVRPSSRNTSTLCVSTRICRCAERAAGSIGAIAAVSVGVVDGRVLCDLPYEEDSRAEVDLNVVMNDSGNFVEIQGTGEHGLFGRAELDAMLTVAEKGCRELIEAQKAALGW